MMNKVFVIIALLFISVLSFAQTSSDALFSVQPPLNLAVTVSLKKVSGTKGDTIYTAHKLYYSKQNGTKDSIHIGLKARGNFRLKNCYFPPMSVKIEKKDAKGTLFEGNKKLKLVLPCDNGKGSNDLILRESLCY